MSESLESDYRLGRAVWKRSGLQSRLIWESGEGASAKVQSEREA